LQYFIFLFRVNDYDDGAAKTDVVLTTKDPEEFEHPENPKIIFVDLPGVGTPTFPDVPSYCEKVSLDDYDAFLILTRDRFTQNDLDLAKKVKSFGKNFFYVRTHIDQIVARACTSSVGEAEILKTIRQDCMYNLKGLVSSEKEIFLISNYYTDKWDFDRLIEAMSETLPVRQRERLTLSLSNVTRECLKRKAKFLKGEKGLRSHNLFY
jgi:GTPase Era involved in 16S rRNA processing